MSVIKITEQNFEAEVLKSDVPVLVDFWAVWCGPCQMQGPIVDELAEEVSGIKFGKLNVDENMSLAQQYRVASIPTLLVFKDGRIAASAVGLQSKDGLKRLLVIAFGRAEGKNGTEKPAKRLPLSSLCVYKDEPGEPVKAILRAARLAPSSFNSQPWRFVVYDNRIHIFSKKYSVEKLKKWDEVNFGIMFANMMVVAEELWLDVDLIRLGDISQKNFPNNQYVLSAILKA